MPIVLAAGGTGFSRAFKLVTNVVNLTPGMLPPIRAARAKCFDDGPYPASTLVDVTALVNLNLLLEMEAIAAPD